MNILLALNVDFDSNSGGLERSSVNLITYLSKQPSILCVCAFNKFIDKIDNIIEVETSITSAVDLKKIIVDHNIDIVLLPGGPWYTLLAAEAVKNTKCKIITAWHFSPGIRVGITFMESFDSFKNSSGIYEKLKALTKIVLFPIYTWHEEQKDKNMFKEAYRISDRFVVLSDSYISNFKKHYAFSNVDKMMAISNSLSFPESISKEGILSKDKTILIVARLDESSKRLTYALKIWKLLEAKNPEWKLQLVGEGKDRKFYESMVLQLQLKRVFFEGKQQPQPFYRKAAIFMMTSKHEGWGLTLTEAQQMGCVPVAMDSFGSLNDIIAQGFNGFMVKNHNIAGYAKQVQLLIDNVELRQTIAENAVQSSSKFSPDKIGKQWLELFQEIHKNYFNC